MVQYAVPTGDVSVTSYENNLGGTTNLYQSVNDGIDGGTPDDSSFVLPVGFGFPTPDVIFWLSGLQEPSTRADDTHELKIRTALVGSFAPNLSLYLIQAPSTTIKTQSFVIGNTSVFETGFTLSQTEANNITDYSQLQVRLNGGLGGSDYAKTTEIEFQIPDAGGGGGGEPPKLHPEFFIALL